MLTVARLREVLAYDPETGIFHWKVSPNGQIRVGDVAGQIVKSGHVRISVDERKYLAHRLAWLYVHGAWPPGLLDHEDTVRANNRLSNLRVATPGLNSANRAGANKGSASGLLGVSRSGRGWKAEIRVDYVSTYLGVFPSKQAAHEAYLVAKQALHPGCHLSRVSR